MFLSTRNIVWLVREPTHLKNMIVKMGSSSPILGVKIQNVGSSFNLRHEGVAFSKWLKDL